MKAFLAVLLALSAFELTVAEHDCDCCFPVPEACCNVTQTEPCCTSDVVVIIDTTGSIPGGANGMDHVRAFTNNLFAALPIGECVCTGFMDFAWVPGVKWSLGDAQSCVHQGGEGAMLRSPGGQTYTWFALDEAGAQLSSAGARADACPMIAILTDGGSDNKLKTKQAADALHAAGVRICVLNVGEWREQRQAETEYMAQYGGGLIQPTDDSFVQFGDLSDQTWADQMAACLCPDDCMKPAP
jgi:hypothetical protein